ncbi:MAG: radical SAM protein, partial [Nitrosospira sp.]
LLRRELAKASYVPEPIALGVNTDAYQPCERTLRLTRRVLEVLQECEHPVALTTKSSLIERDIDLLAEMACKRQVAVAITLTTLDHAIACTLEPRAAAPARRLRTIRTLTDAGIPVGVSIAPVIPFVTEPELEWVIAAAAEAGAINASYVVLRLPWEVSPLFRQWLQAHFPDRAQRVMNRVRDMRGGKDYDATFGKRMHGEGIWADMIRQRFEKAVLSLGIGLRSGRLKGLDTSHFRPPAFSASITPPAPAANARDKRKKGKKERLDNLSCFSRGSISSLTKIQTVPSQRRIAMRKFQSELQHPLDGVAFAWLASMPLDALIAAKSSPTLSVSGKLRANLLA